MTTFSKTTSLHSVLYDQVSVGSSGELISKWLARAKRELIQKECAMRRIKIMNKSRPKRDRESDVQKGRDVKEQRLYQEELIEHQGPILKVAAAAFAGLSAIVCCKKVSAVSKRVDDALASAVKLCDAGTVAVTEVGDTFGGINAVTARVSKIISDLIGGVKAVCSSLWQLSLAALL